VYLRLHMHTVCIIILNIGINDMYTFVIILRPSREIISHLSLIYVALILMLLLYAYKPCGFVQTKLNTCMTPKTLDLL
jgi:hypothetical protein